MKIGVFSSKPYDQRYLDEANQSHNFDLEFLQTRLNPETVTLAKPYDAVCVFVNDLLNATVLNQLADFDTTHIALRCAGFNNLDLTAANTLGLSVSRVPAYSPEAVAEHTVALMMTLNRKTHKAYNRVKENNFNLDGLMGFNFFGCTVGVVGAGNIGQAVIKILNGLGCRVLCHDPYLSASASSLDMELVGLATLFAESDVITLHCPVTAENHHLIDAKAIEQMKTGVMLINTSRGALVDTQAVIRGLKRRKIGYLGLDVYEMESELFFQDLSLEIVEDDVFERLAGFPNVLVTGHQGFFTHQAMQQIAHTTLANLALHQQGKRDPETFLTS